MATTQQVIENLKSRIDGVCKDLEALKNQIAAEEKRQAIDWSKMPKDTLVEVSNNGGKRKVRYFSHVDGNGQVFCFARGQTSLTSDDCGTYTWDNSRLIDNPPKPWFGGACPVPDGVRMKIWFKEPGLMPAIVTTASLYSWYLTNGMGVIMAYQILGEDHD